MKNILLLFLTFASYITTNAQNIIQLNEVGNGFVKPVDLASNGVDENLYIVEQQSTIRPHL